ncbi:MAG: nuclear transport factor 2 family protein [Gemmatimonadaceae bacterium]
MRVLLVLGVGICLSTTTSVAQDPAAVIRGLDSAWARAYATHDTTLALSLFADNLVVTSVGGSLKDRAGELADIRAQPDLKMEYFRTTDFAVRVHEGTAVVTGLAEWRYTMKGQLSNPRRRYTAVYVRGGPLGWRMLALHMGRAPEG